MTPRLHAAFAAGASLVVLAAIVCGFVLVGSPATRRLERLDERRLADLQTIAREIQMMVEDSNVPGKLKGALPKTLAEAAARATADRLNPRDPATGEPYGYTLKDEHSYELCATFELARDSATSVFWNHAAGWHCFTIDVLDPPPFY